MGRLYLAASSATTSIVLLVWFMCYFVTSVRSQSIVNSCIDDTWSLLPDGYTCYKAYNAPLEYPDASAQCRAYGAHLADPHNRVENNFIGDLAVAAGLSNYWIGLNREGLGDTVTSNITSDSGESQAVEAYYWAMIQPDMSASSLYVSSAEQESYYPYVYGNSLGSGRDKRGFVCQREACVDTMLACFSGECVVGMACDDVDDCTDGTDELACDGSCHYTQEDASGTVESDHPYTDNADCSWLLVGTPDTQIKLEITALDTEQNLDEVQIWIGGPTQNSATLYKRLSGNTPPTDPIYSNNNFLLIIFTSDSSVTGNGFSATWTAEALVAVDVEMLTADTMPMEITSPNYPEFLLSSLRVNYVISAVGQRSVVTLQIAELEWTGATDAYIEVIDGSVNTGPVLARLSFGANNPSYVMSVSNSMMIYVHTESEVPDGFYKFYYWEGCNVVLNETSGTVISPGFGVLNYPNFQDCTFTVTSPSPEGFKAIASASFALEDGVDLLTIYDGMDNTGTELLTDATGTSLATSTFTSPSGTFYIVFTSSSVGNDMGFSIEFSTDCPDPGFSNSTITVPDPYISGLGDSITVSCETGYEFGQEAHYNETEVTMTCSSTGWDVLQIPNCQAVCCNQPAQIENGYVETSTGVSYTETVTYSCYQGYAVTGSATIACQDDGTWEAAPTCTIQPCTAITSVTNGQVAMEIGDGTSQGSIMNVTCDPGYEISGALRLICSGGAWSADTPTCEPRACPLPVIADATVTPDPVVFMEQLTVTCNEGYELNGTATLTCNVDQLFDEDFPNCIDIDECLLTGDDDVCVNDASCANSIGSYTCYCAEGFEVDLNLDGGGCADIDECTTIEGLCNQGCVDFDGDQGMYECRCDDGYVLYDEAGAQGIPLAEGETGLLLGDIYYINHTCVPLQCPDLAEFGNGTILTTLTTFHTGDTVYFMCDLGYELNGAESITCGDGDTVGWGLWTADQPTCEVADCAPPDVSGSMFAPAFSAASVLYGEFITITCTHHQPTPLEFTRECVYDQVTNTYRFLMDDLLECPVIDCGDHEAVSGGDYTDPADNYLGTSFTVACVTGFSLEGNSSLGTAEVTCGADGFWDLGDIACIGAQCADPGTPPDGQQVIAGSYEVGSVVTFTCNRTGYEPEPPNGLTCELDTVTGDVSFDGTAPTCLDVDVPVFTNCPEDTLVVDRLTAPAFAVLDATDNTMVNTIVRSVTDFSPDHIINADITVDYTATDFQGLQETCTVDIRIRDDIAPVITCPEAYTHYISDENSNMVDYTGHEATAVDAVDPAVNITYDPPFIDASASDLGSYFIVTASATDMDGNTATCQFMVVIEASPCMDWALPAPVGGNKTCTSDGSGGFTCTMTCQPVDGVETFMFYNVSETAIEPELVYTCTAGNDWDRGSEVPSCTLPILPLYSFGATYVYTLDGGATTVDMDACGDGYTTSFVNDVKSIAEGGLEDLCHSQALQEGGNVNYDIIMDTNLIMWTFDNDTLEVSMYIRYEVGPNSLLQVSLRTCGTIIEILAALPLNNPSLSAITSITGDGGSCPNLVMDTTTPGVVANPDAGFNCQHGWFQYQGGSEQLEYCTPCPTGSYFSNVTQLCTLCPVGTYQDTPGERSCIDCSSGTNTLSTGRTSIDECIDECDTYGMVSSSGLPLCNPCAMGTYLEDARTCGNCSGDTSTRGGGAVGVAECLAACQEGHYSFDGFEMCTPCPLHFYQPNTNSLTCEECADGMMTLQTGSVSIDNCTDAATELCVADACLNGGTCRIFNHYKVCDCAPGYTGDTCDVMIDYCESNPCYFGNCQTEVNGYTCDCPSVDYSGDRCENDPDDCTSIVCENQGQCYDFPDSGICVCPTGYTGDLCEIGDDVCDPDPCNGVGQCVPFGSIRYQCHCDPGYEGVNCEINIDECASSPCLYGGVCTDDVNGYSCACPDGYGPDDSCATRPDICNADECTNAAECVDDFRSSTYLCVCNQGFERQMLPNTWYENVTGLYSGPCGMINFCDPNPCNQSADCLGSINDYSCNCPNGYSGKNCQHNTDDCLGEPCMNGGTCTDMLLGYTCECASGFEGDDCEDNINECNADPCDPDGTNTIGGGVNGCVDEVGSFYCVCNDGYVGTNCSINVDDCASLPCRHGAPCTDLVNDYSCDCTPGWGGKDCDEMVDYCAVDYCQNDAACYSIFDDYYCECVGQTYGQNCSLEASICRDANPCLGDGSTCTEDADGVASCQCGIEFTGDCCHVTKDFCSGDGICVAGTCTSSGGSFTCSCYDDFEGLLCDVSRDDCDGVTCGNGGECVDGIGTYYCDCPIGFTGVECDKEVDEDYDLYCFAEDRDNNAFHAYPFVLNVTSFTLSFWVKYSEFGGTGTLFTLYGLNERYSVSPKTELIRIDESELVVSFGGAVEQTGYTDGLGVQYDFNTGNWLNFVVTYDSSSTDFKIYINTLEVGTISTYGSGAQLAPYGWIELGDYTDPVTGLPTGFNGYLSRVNMWNRALTSEELSALINVQDVTDGQVLLWENYQIGSGCTFVSPSTAMVTGGDSPAPPAATATFDSCPDDVYILSSDRQTAATWTEPTFSGSTLNPASLYNSGYLFVWGVYYNTYKLEDSEGNVAVCRFRIYVRRFDCDAPATPALNDPNDCSDVGDFRSCAAVCPAGMGITVPAPNFYTCDRLGTFNPMTQYHNTFTVPSCGVVADTTRTITIIAPYPDVQNCEAVVSAGGIVAQVVQRVTELNGLWFNAAGDGAFCPSGNCEDDILIDITCGIAAARRRRRQLSDGMTGNYTFPNIEDPIVDASGNEMTPEDVLNMAVYDDGLLDGDNVLGDTGFADLTNIEMASVPSCVPGQVVDSNNQCVTCAVGSYHDVAKDLCIPCPIGTYQNVAGMTECIECGTDMTTDTTGSTSDTNCYASCTAGQYFDMTANACTDCEIGFYQPLEGQFYCEPCAADKTTADVATQMESECLDACVQDGTELSADGTCVDCEIGYYRDASVEDVCEPCEPAFVTAGTGSVSVAECLVPNCAPGSHIDGSSCTECDVGFYQPDSWQAECLPCDANYTTMSMGSVNMTECIRYCPDGHEYVAATDACEPCAIGYTKENAVDGLLSECVLCPAEFITMDVGTVSASDCNVGNCTAGQELDETTNLCINCTIGFYSDMMWASNCTECPTQRTTEFEGSNSEELCLLNCEAGFEGELGADTCTECMIGYYKEEAGLSLCTPCTDGLITASTGSTMEAQCDVEDCGPGYFSDLTSGSTCSPCDMGSYQPASRQTGCLDCDPDRTTFDEASTNVTDCVLDCPDGQQYDFDTGTCVVCPRGYYRKQGMQDLCELCPVLYITADVGAVLVTECTIGNCTEGEELDDADMGLCSPCPRGMYQSEIWQEDCMSCDDGQTTANERSTSVDECVEECDDGNELDLDTMMCQPCARGYYRTASESFECLMCDPEWVTAEEGAILESDCTVPNCTTDMIINAAGDGCEACPAGSSQPLWWQTECDETDECAVNNGGCLSEILGGLCNNTVGSFECTCQPYHEGDGTTECTHFCSLTPSYCKNGGTCTYIEGLPPTCDCTEYYSGPTCDLRTIPASNTETIIGGVIGGVIGLILLILLLLAICWCCRAGEKPHKPRRRLVPVAAPIVPYMPSHYQPTYIPGPMYEPLPGMVKPPNPMAGSLAGSLGRNMALPNRGPASLAGYGSMPAGSNYMFYEDADENPVQSGTGSLYARSIMRTKSRPAFEDMSSVLNLDDEDPPSNGAAMNTNEATANGHSNLAGNGEVHYAKVVRKSAYR